MNSSCSRDNAPPSRLRPDQIDCTHEAPEVYSRRLWRPLPAGSFLVGLLLAAVLTALWLHTRPHVALDAPARRSRRARHSRRRSAADRSSTTPSSTPSTPAQPKAEALAVRGDRIVVRRRQRRRAGAERRDDARHRRRRPRGDSRPARRARPLHGPRRRPPADRSARNAVLRGHRREGPRARGEGAARRMDSRAELGSERLAEEGLADARRAGPGGAEQSGLPDARRRPRRARQQGARSTRRASRRRRPIRTAAA